MEWQISFRVAVVVTFWKKSEHGRSETGGVMVRIFELGEAVVLTRFSIAVSLHCSRTYLIGTCEMKPKMMLEKEGFKRKGTLMECFRLT